jgi:hypothetical protein
MPAANHKRSGSRSRSKSKAPMRRAARSPGTSHNAPDAISLLKSDHREVEGFFAQFEKTKASYRTKKALVAKICDA